MQAKRRIVITGIGSVTPLGQDIQTTWRQLLAGRSGVNKLTRFDTQNWACQIGAEVPSFSYEPYLTLKEIKKLDPFIQLGIIAGIQAVKDANLDMNRLNLQRVGTAVSAGIGGMHAIEANHQHITAQQHKRISPFFVPNTIVNMISGHLSMRYGFQGPNFAVATACASGAHNLGMAARTIAYGDADMMIAGGAEMITTPLGLGGFLAAKALSTRNDQPQAASRPWDQDRDGFVLGEGAGVLVLEEYEHAKSRDAHIYAELVGFGMSSDAHHITLPSPEGSGAALAMHNALHDAGIKPGAIDYINAHGTSTHAGDLAEVLAVKTVFKEHAQRLMISSTKSMTGHLLGAAGAVETIFTALALQNNMIPPTINLDKPDQDMDLDFVPHEARSAAITYALCNSFGFGGTNAALVLKSA
jgi:3-oxoacyl-[acyl-carrier-protein] synthase II